MVVAVAAAVTMTQCDFVAAVVGAVVVAVAVAVAAAEDDHI